MATHTLIDLIRFPARLLKIKTKVRFECEYVLTH